MPNIENYLGIQWQILYIIILLIAYIVIDKNCKYRAKYFIFAIIFAIPVFIFLTQYDYILGPYIDNAPTTTPRNENYTGLNYTLIALMPGMVIAAVVAKVKDIIEEIKINKEIKRRHENKEH